MGASESVIKIFFSAYNGCKYSAELDKSPFANGRCRLAFKGILHGESGQKLMRCVIKIFQDSSMNSFKKCNCEMQASVVANWYATIFNKLLIYNNLTKSDTVEFLIPFVVYIIGMTEHSNYFTIGTHVSIEPFLDGTYQKFNSNGGHEDRTHPLMSAFCHWTWQYSSYNLMVCDLQGVCTGQKYVLTDPAIHSKHEAFGITDLGTDGMNKVMNKHQCTPICSRLGLFILQKRHDREQNEEKHTTYDFRKL